MLGVKCAVVDKATSFSKHPQAHFINNRSMEVGFFVFPVVKIVFGCPGFLNLNVSVLIYLDLSCIGWIS